jgi:hypothetical protein
LDPQKILVTIVKETHHAILDLGSTFNILSEELYDFLNLDRKIENCDIDLLLTNFSIKQALGRIDNTII